MRQLSSVKCSEGPSPSSHRTRMTVRSANVVHVITLTPSFALTAPQERRATTSSASKSRRATKPREDYESSASDSEDEYVQAKLSTPGKAKKRTSRKSTTNEDGEPKAQRKRKRHSPVEIDLSDLPPEQGESS